MSKSSAVITLGKTQYLLMCAMCILARTMNLILAITSVSLMIFGLWTRTINPVVCGFILFAVSVFGWRTFGIPAKDDWCEPLDSRSSAGEGQIP